jgi:hypothetical protein
MNLQAKILKATGAFTEKNAAAPDKPFDNFVTGYVLGYDQAERDAKALPEDPIGPTIGQPIPDPNAEPYFVGESE